MRCLYDYLNTMDLTGIDWKAERKANLTSSYYGLAALYSPLEALFFEELVQNIRRGKLPMHMTPGAQAGGLVASRHVPEVLPLHVDARLGLAARPQPADEAVVQEVLQHRPRGARLAGQTGEARRVRLLRSGISGSGTRFSTWPPWTFTAPLEASVVGVVQKGFYRQYNKD